MDNATLPIRWAFVFLFAGCASAPVPTARLASTQAAVRAAEEVGAEKAPQAELHLKLAKEGLDQAKGLISNDDNDRAGWVLARAEADAELSLSLAKETTARADAQKTLDELLELRRKAQ
jgi:hypothetical protein